MSGVEWVKAHINEEILSSATIHPKKYRALSLSKGEGKEKRSNQPQISQIPYGDTQLKERKRERKERAVGCAPDSSQH